jgi:hypothetical protein
VISTQQGCDGPIRFLTLGKGLLPRYGSPGGTSRLEYYMNPAQPQGEFRRARLSAGAIDTGFREDECQLWIDPSKPTEAVYLVRPGRIERWPRVDFGCA